MEKARRPLKKEQALGLATVFVAAIFVLAGLLCWRWFSAFPEMENRSVSIPLALREPRVLLGGEYFSREQFYKREKLGYWQTVLDSLKQLDKNEREIFIGRQSAIGIFEFDDLKIGEFDGQDGLDVVVASPREAFILDRSGKLKYDVGFDLPKYHYKYGWFSGSINATSIGQIQVVDVENDGKAEFFARGKWDGAVLFGFDGRRRWEFGARKRGDSARYDDFDIQTDPYIEDSAIGDLNGDGKAEIFVGRSNDGLRAFSFDGTELWYQPRKDVGEPLAIFDADGDGKNDLVEFNNVSKQEAFLLTDFNGKLFKEIKFSSEMGRISFLPDAEGRKTQVFSFNEPKARLADSYGNMVFELDAPLSEVESEYKRRMREEAVAQATPIYDKERGTMTAPMPGGSYANDTESVYESQAAWAKLKSNEPEFLAVVGNFIGLKRAAFYIYSSDGKLVYHEILPEDAKTVAVLPTGKEDGIEDVLVGGKHTVWRYTAK